jgi:HAD superfamily hydrolase (TIGR01450 family)
MTADPKTGTWVIDLDGVIWLATQPIPGSSEAVARVRAAGIKVLFCTNNAATTSQALVDRLGAVGIPAQGSELISSARAAASLLDPGSKAFVCGEKGILEALAARGVEVVTDAPADAVIVGWTRSFDFDLLAKSMSVVGKGARLIGTNEDATYPTPSGLIPGAGSILAAVARASQTDPLVAGKPYGPMADLVRHTAPDLTLVVGDRPSTDGLFAKRLGMPFALVHTGVTPADHGTLEQVPDFEAADLSGIADLILGK